MPDVVYLDYNATAPLCEEAKAAMLAAYDMPLNPSSLHGAGRYARKLMEDARTTLSQLAGAGNAHLIFTASGTEANNLALQAIDHVDVLVSQTEHPSVLKASGFAGTIPVDGNGVVRLDALEKLLKASTQKVLVSVMLANNETGVIQPIKEIVALAREHRAYVHTDAVQAFGKVPVSMDELGVDMMTISSHKIGGGAGAAALLVKKPLLVKAQIVGGGQEKSFRAGTENVVAICGFAAAADARIRHMANNDNIGALTQWLETRLTEIAPEALVVAKDVARLPNTVCVLMPGVSNETQLIHFDMAGIAVSSGSACSSGKVEASHVLQAMGIADEDAACAVRISLGKETTKQEIAEFISAWEALYRRTKQKNAV